MAYFLSGELKFAEYKIYVSALDNVKQNYQNRGTILSLRVRWSLAETDSVDLQMAVAGVVLAIAYIGVNPSPRAYFDFCI
jgi:hypothetical protein